MLRQVERLFSTWIPRLPLLILCLSLSLSLFDSADSSTVETNSPDTTWQVYSDRRIKWLVPTFAFSSEDWRTYTSFSMAWQGYRGYGFSLSETDVIDSVEVGIEGYKDSGGVGVYVSWDGATTQFDNWDFCFAPLNLGGDVLYWDDITNNTEWTPAKLDDSNLRASIRYLTGAGCYGLDAEVGLWSGGLKKVGAVKVGDVLTGWIVDDVGGHFAPALVENMTIHSGKWDVLRIIAESTQRKHDFKDVLVTPEHMLPYGRSQTDISNKQMSEKRADEFQVGDWIFGFMEGQYDFVNKFQRLPYFESYRVHNITKMVVDGVADIQTNCTYFMGHYMLEIKVPWTCYVDWLPIRVTYTSEVVSAVSWVVFYFGCIFAFVFFIACASVFHR